MDFTIDKTSFLKGLSSIIRIIDKHANPILAHIHFKLEDTRLILTASDTNIDLVTILPVTHVKTTGSLLILGQILFDIVRQCPEDDLIHLYCHNTEDSFIHFTAGKSHFKIPFQSTQQYPHLQVHSFSHTLKILRKDFFYLIKKTLFSAAADGARYYLNGIYLHTYVNNNQTFLCSVATDGHRLSKADVLYTEAIPTFPGIIVPRKSAGEILKLMEHFSEETIELSMNPQILQVSTPDFSFTSKLVEGTYPTYQKVIPQKTKNCLTIHRLTLLESIKRISAISMDRIKTIEFKIDHNQLILCTKNKIQGGDGKEILEAQYPGEKLNILFNVYYLTEALNNMDTQEIIFYYTSYQAPVLIQPDNDESLLVVMMPVSPDV